MAQPHIGMRTGDDERFVRRWYEVSISELAKPGRLPDVESCQIRKWAPFLKGGEFRKWYGNLEHVVNWENDGYEIKKSTLAKYPGLSWDNLGWKISNEDFYFQPCITWSDISLLHTFGVRYCGSGFIISTIGCGIHGEEITLLALIGLLNSKPTKIWLPVINPSLHANPGDLAQIPVCQLDEHDKPRLEKVSQECIQIGIQDWDSFERSWDFQFSPLLALDVRHGTSLESSNDKWTERSRDLIFEMRQLEEKNNSLLIGAYGLANELTPEVSTEQITLTINPAYRYGGQLTEEEQWVRFRRNSMEELISYALGCMMGRYSLDEPGLIYANAGNIGFDATRYKTFLADADGIVPITDELWFEDDATNRVREFLNAVWGAETLEENMDWLAESLGKKGTETPIETIRRYLSGSFHKDHLQTYKKRPIYWHFSSGKQGAFQALVYLHRYHEGTLARMRAEYVVPLTGKMQSRIEMLEKDRDAATSTAARTKLAKQIESLKKKHVELLAYDEKLRHYADMRIQLDLDDGVKVNYGKFGDLLAEVKAVTGGAGDE
ncbi:MAG: BREX-1 system adenine-specific DNA-methyltransferase PglX [Propionivibrio sp.]|nr:BREX-1 system adenine-specific DNA-methyltransferase PglX [Propionivibrio sp.]